MAWDDRLKDFCERRAPARAMGGAERLARRAAEGRLNARERVHRLLDAGSFLEVGTFNTSDIPGMEAVTPADSKIAGFGTSDRRPVAVGSNEFTGCPGRFRASRARGTVGVPRPRKSSVPGSPGTLPNAGGLGGPFEVPHDN